MEKRWKIIYEDEYYLVIDKPPGILVIPTPKGEKNTLTDLINSELAGRGTFAKAHPCHRLDRETSGLIIYAKGKKAQRLMMEEFNKRKVKKRYAAFVHGNVERKSGMIGFPVYNRNKNRKEEAFTKYNVLQKKKGFTVLEVEPVTGRTNQIRIHLKGIGHPIVGESVYAFRKDFALKFKRAALHAAHLAFRHPLTGKAASFESPLPSDMRDFLNTN